MQTAFGRVCTPFIDMIGSLRKILNALTGASPASAPRLCPTLEEYVIGTANSVARLSVGLPANASLYEFERHSMRPNFIHPVAVERDIVMDAFEYATVSHRDYTAALIWSCDEMRRSHNLDCTDVIANPDEENKIFKRWQEFFRP